MRNKRDKQYRADNTYIISTDSTDNPKLGAKALSNGRESLFLDYYLGFEIATSKNGREYKKVNNKREYLKLYLWDSPRSPKERLDNKETLELAKDIRAKKQIEMKENALGVKIQKLNKVNFIQYFEEYAEKYSKADKRMVNLALKRFKSFIEDKPQYKRFTKETLYPESVTKAMMEEFVEYLKEHGRGEGPHTLFARFKKFMKVCTQKGVFIVNPVVDLTIPIDKSLKKEILSLEEIQLLADTKEYGENPHIRRAFLFCCYAGLRFCDVKELTYANVDYSNRLLRFEQSKTKGKSSASTVVIPLNDGLLKLIGEPEEDENGNIMLNKLIFSLPSYEMCLKALQHWTKRAKITKHISWHCARHSFATNILDNGANIAVVGALLGHSSLQHTQKYLRAVDKRKQEAIDSLPELRL